MFNDDEETREIPLQSMASLVYGAPRPRRARLPLRLIFVAAFLSTIGCAHLQPAPAADAPESVGALSASTTHVYVQPVHADTDLSVAFQPAGSDEDAAEPMKVATKADGGGDAELPEVAPKTDGVTTGAVR